MIILIVLFILAAAFLVYYFKSKSLKSSDNYEVRFTRPTRNVPKWHIERPPVRTPTDRQLQNFSKEEKSKWKSREKFWNYWRTKWEKGDPVNIDGQNAYVFLYLFELLTQNDDYEKISNELHKVLKNYGHESIIRRYVKNYLVDTYVLMGKLEKAWNVWKKTAERYNEDMLLPNTSREDSKYWTLKRHLGIPLRGKEIFSLVNLTDFGRSHKSEIRKKFDEIIESYENENTESLVKRFTSKKGKWLAYRPHKGESKIPGYDGNSPTKNAEVQHFVFNTDKAKKFLNSGLANEAENKVREKFGVPKVGEGWTSETKLKNILTSLLEPTGYEVQHRASPSWLGAQHLDVFIPGLEVGFEYMGRQHYESVDYFGGEESLEETKRRDKKKEKKCKANGVNLVKIKYDESLSPDHIASRLTNNSEIAIEDLKDQVETYESKETKSYKQMDSSISSKSDQKKDNADQRINIQELEKKFKEEIQRDIPGSKDLPTAHLLRAKAGICRKHDYVKKAEDFYWESIIQYKKEERGVIYSSYRELAKLYYHTGNKSAAVQVLDCYLGKQSQSGGKNKLKKLRDRLANGDFRQLKNKYNHNPKVKFPKDVNCEKS